MTWRWKTGVSRCLSGGGGSEGSDLEGWVGREGDLAKAGAGEVGRD
jgi:hypothetical protein